MEKDKLPPCGVYRTSARIGAIPAGKLVYFHNHGDPGPGIYLPTEWTNNRAEFAESGHTMEKPDQESAALQALPTEGLYRVTKEFFCCDMKCHNFEIDLLVQLGYDGDANTLLFEPEWIDGVFEFPDEGTRIDEDKVHMLAPLKVREHSHDDEEDEEQFDTDPKLLH